MLSCIRPNREATKDEQKRGIEGKFAPGTTDDKYNINIFKVMDFPSDQLDENLLKGKSLQIKTKKTGEKVSVSVSKDVTIKSDRSTLKPYYLVDYDILSPKTDTETILSKLVGKIDDFRGFPDTFYRIVPHLYNNYLILYRVSDKEKLPYIEAPLSVKVGNKLATPLVGYPIEYCIEEKVLDTGSNKETGQYRFKCKDVAKEAATYIRLIENKANFSYLVAEKKDIFPSGFFAGDWFFVEIVVKSSGDQSTGGLGQHQDFQNAALVEFEPTSNSLEAVDTKRFKMDEKDTLSNFSIPVEWKEYKIEGDSGTLDKYKFSETEKTTTKNIERPYFIIDFAKLAEKDNQEIDKVHIEDDYFSFTIKTRDARKNTWKKYAFKRVVENPDYVQKRWFERDSSLFFPVFQVNRKYYKTARDHTEQDQEKYIRTTRFDPRSHNGSSVKIIKWYFSKQTPQLKWVRDFGHTAVDYWDKVFQEAGKKSGYKIRIVLCDPHSPNTLCDENEDKELGDIRYNILNMMYSEQGHSAPLLGYGPNIANPITGETLSATANIWVHTIVNQYVKLIRNYIRFHVYPPAWKLLPESPGVTDFIDSKIKKKCSDVTGFIIFEQEKNEVFNPIHSRLDDSDIVWNCAKKMSEVNILNTTLHEMGHGLAYRHVFTGSTDEDNFYKSYDEIKRVFGEDIDVESMDGYPDLPQYSTVMDYAHPYFPGMSVPGKYDIAVTKFVYFDQVELEGGGVLHVPSGEKEQKPIVDVIKEAQQAQASREDAAIEGVSEIEVKKYKVCGGKHKSKPQSDIHPDNPLCAQHDYGVTPKEIVENMIRVHQDHIMTGYKKYDSNKLEMPDFGSRDFGIKTVDKMVKISNKLQSYITQLIKAGNKKVTDYFFLDQDKVDAYKDLIQTEADNNSEFNLYYEARKPILDYLKKLFYLPPKHCVYETSEGQYHSIALEVIWKRIQAQHSDSGRDIFMDCKSPSVQKWADENSLGHLVTEVGFFVSNRQYFVKPRNTDEDPIDEYSIFASRPMEQQQYAMLRQMFGMMGMDISSLLMHSHWMEVLVANNLMLSTMYDPIFLKDIIAESKEYVLQGIDLNPYLNRGNMADKYKDVNLPRVLSYEIDAMAGTLYNPQALIQPIHQYPVQFGLFGLKLAVIEAYNNNVLYPNLSESDTEQIKSYYMHGAVVDTSKLAEISEWVQVDDTDSLSAEQVPFLLEAYEEYKKSKEGNPRLSSFITFVRNHDLVCAEPGVSRVMMPYVSTNMAAEMCKNFNLFRKCIKRHSDDTPCERIDDKRIHNRFISGLIGG